MKKSLEASLIQEWCLVGMKPMHRALLRTQVANAAAALTPDAAGEKKLIGREFAWHVLSNQRSTGEGTQSQVADSQLSDWMVRLGIVVVDRKTALDQSKNGCVGDRWFGSSHHRSIHQIRLLWHWSLRGKQDLLWCTEKGFDGIIYNPESLRQWVRVCIRNGKANAVQNNWFLKCIELPKLVCRS